MPGLTSIINVRQVEGLHWESIKTIDLSVRPFPFANISDLL